MSDLERADAGDERGAESFGESNSSGDGENGMHADANAATPILETAATTVSENVQEEECLAPAKKRF